MYILGINSYHADSSACLLYKGKIITAIEEERFTRVKHWAGFPINSIKNCLSDAGIKIKDIDHVAINQDHRANRLRRLVYFVKNTPSIGLIKQKLNNRKNRLGVLDDIMRSYNNDNISARIHYVEHHLAHIASAYYVSPFEESVALSIDGFGDFSSTAWGIGSGNNLTIKKRVYFPHSLGIFYQALTQYLGFNNYGDEFKVMGLASYGSEQTAPDINFLIKQDHRGGFRLDLKYFRHHKQKIEFNWDGGSPIIGKLYSDLLEQKLGPARHKDSPLEQRHMDLAKAVQLTYEEVFLSILNKAYDSYGVSNLVLSGGCAMNSVANGKVLANTPFKKVYVQPAAGDAGGAIGAACVVWNQLVGNNTSFTSMDTAYMGSSYTDDQIESVINQHSQDSGLNGISVEKYCDDTKLYTDIATLISEGKIIGWFQGSMEWGPRALGNRSILADPRRKDMKEILNLKIKRRESFRPFAPSILRERVADWFEIDDEVPFMMKVYQIRQHKQHLIPAVTHVDGSGRLQTVTRKTNHRYAGLIEAFETITGVPILLNTSFNENEPIVRTPQEALNCFLRTKMDILILGNWCLKRN